MGRTYKVKFKEFDKDEEQVLEVKTNDIDFTLEQIGRNRNIEWFDVKQKLLPTFDEGDVVGPSDKIEV
jgi:hypothetical protein